MPSEKCYQSNRIQSYIFEFDSKIFSIDGKILHCQLCHVKVYSEKKYNVT